MPATKTSQATAAESANRAALVLKPGTLIPAFLAGLVFQMFRVDQHRWIPAIWIEFAICLSFSVVMFLAMRRWLRHHENPIKPKTLSYLAQAGAGVSVAALLGWQYISRSLGLGDANEIVALMTIQCISWHVAVFASVRGFERASLLLCGAVVFFVCSMTKRFDVLACGAIFAVSSLWWLAGIYWSRLDSKAIDGDAKTLQIHGTSTGIAVAAIAIAVGIGLLVPFTQNQYSVNGFMPFSGGEQGYQDEFATSGVGDGNMLTSGNNATTTGAVDSDEFIEDDKPSMFDVVSEMYDGPVKKKVARRKRAIALNAKAKHLHDAKKSEQAGRTFRTMRNTDRAVDIELKDRISKALFYVEGSLPARFAVDSFQLFDGWDWSKTSLEGTTPKQPKIKLQRRFNQPAFVLASPPSSYLTTSRSHRVKMMRLESANIPAPSFLKRWRIDKVEDLGIFLWSDAGLVQYNGAAIPPQTVIDVEGLVPNYHLMRSANDLRQGRGASWKQRMSDEIFGAENAGERNPDSIRGDSESPFLQIPESGIQQADQLAKRYTANIAPGWNQVEAIVDGIRSDFKLNPDWEVDQSTEDTVSHFMQQGGGPSWMFATSCAMALRSAGYKTRFTSGFVVTHEDYDRRSRQSIVTSRNLHMWPEVCLDGKFWIPVEPTPGYPTPFATETAWQWVSAKISAVVTWIWRHPVASSLIAAMLTLGWLYRAYLVTHLMLLWWQLVRLAWPSQLVRTTRQLIDLRFWAAGDRRPQSRTIQTWYSRVETGLSTDFVDLWNMHNFSKSPPNISRADLVSRCKEQVANLTLKKIQEHVSGKSEKANS